MSSYNEDQHKWKQAHTQGAWVISKFIMENQKEEVLKITNKTAHDFVISINKENIEKEGHELIGKLLNAI